jgi:hypothetical protein
MEHLREGGRLCQADERTRSPAFAGKRCGWWDQRLVYPCHDRMAFACSLIPGPPPQERFVRTRRPAPGVYGGRRTAGLTSLLFLTAQGKVVPLGRWYHIRGRGTLTPLHLTPYHLGPSLTAALARRTSRPLPALPLVLTLIPVCLAPDGPVLLAGVVSAHAFTTVPHGKRFHCPTGFRHHCLPW